LTVAQIAPLTPAGFADLLTRFGVDEFHNTINQCGHGVAELEGEPSYLTATEMIRSDDTVKPFSWPTDPSRKVLRPDMKTFLF
jgi:hypothetical protein